MHETPNGLTNELAIADVEDLADAPEPRQDRLLRSASKTVAELAPPPATPAPEDYREAARDAEIAVIDFMVTTQGGLLKSSSLSGVSNESYAGFDAVQRAVASAMGRYFVGVAAPAASGSAGASVRNVTPEPLWSPGDFGLG